MVTRLSEVLQSLSNSSSKLEVTGVLADVQLIIKKFFNDFLKSCNHHFEVFLKDFQKFFFFFVYFFFFIFLLVKMYPFGT